MKIPIVPNQFAARLSEEDLVFVNEILPDLFPNRDLADDSLTGRQIFMAIVEAASLKLLKKNASNPGDLQMIEDLTASANRLSEEKRELAHFLESADTQALAQSTEIERLQGVVKGLNDEIYGIEIENTVSKDRVLKLEKYVPVVNEMRIVLEPLVNSVLNLYAEKLRLRTKDEITPGKILTSLFVRYITKRETEFPGFPFLITKAEVIELHKGLESE